MENRLFRFCRYFVRKYLQVYTVVETGCFVPPEAAPAAIASMPTSADVNFPGNVNSSEEVRPKVYIVHHQNLRGPITAMAWFDRPLRPWVLSVFCERQECFDQFYNYTFTQRFGFKKPFAAALAFPLSFGVPALMRSIRVIPVYRQPRETIKTFRQSLDALAAGEDLLISPDVDYTSTSIEIGEVYDGFLSLDKHYYRNSKKHIGFVPLHVDTGSRRILVGTEVVLRDEIPFIEAKKEAAQKLRADINSMEQSCPH